MKYLTLIFLAGGLALNLHGAPAAPGDSEVTFEQATGLLAFVLARAEHVEIYEGVPREKLPVDPKTTAADFRQITDQWVNSTPRDFHAKHVAKLQRMIGERLLQPWQEKKSCGGFHADYVLAVPTPKDTIYLLCCFGCREARIVREGNPFSADVRTPDFRFTVNLYDKNFEELRSLLTGYRQEPPR